MQHPDIPHSSSRPSDLVSQQPRVSRARLPEGTRGFEVESLIPRADPGNAARHAVENLYNVVSEWPAESLVVLCVRRWKRGIRLYGWVNDAVPNDWFADLRYVFKPIAAIRRAADLPVPPRPSLEVVEARGELYALLEDTPLTAARAAGSGRDAVPLHRNDPMWDLLEVLDTGMTISVSPASEIERQMADSAWAPTFSGGNKSEWQMYRDTPIRTRVTVGEVSARTLAELKIMTVRTRFEPLNSRDAEALQVPSVDQLLGYALPKGAACAKWHLPAAAIGHPVPGMKVARSAAHFMPYERPKRPVPALRLGSARDHTGKKKAVLLSSSDLMRHMSVVGASGSGKSTVIRALLLEWVTQGRGAVLLDPSGDLCRSLAGDIEDSERVLYLDYSRTGGVAPFNPLRGETDEEFEARVQAFVSILGERDSEEFVGPRWRRNFGLIARGCRALLGDRASLVAVFSILGEQALVQRLAFALRSIDRTLADQIQREMGSVSGDSASELWSWMISKGEEVLGSRALTAVLATGFHGLDLAAAMENNMLVLVNLGLSRLGERSAQLLGSMMVSEVRSAALARGTEADPYLLVLDEAQLFQYGALPRLLDEGRKYSLGVVVCHQRPDQLRFQVKDALSANASSRLQLRSGNPADILVASELLGGWPKSDLAHLPDLRAAAVISRDGQPSEPFSLTVDFFRKHKDLLADQTTRAERLARVESESWDRLIRPYVGAVRMTREWVSQYLDEAARQQQDVESKRARAGRTN